MARNWIVLTAARAPHAVNVIIAYTEWDDYVALADEVVYSNPVDADGNAVDALWKVSGTVTLAGGVYTYLDPGTEPTLANRQRSQIYDAYLHWRIFGRTDHWTGLRRGVTDPDDNDRDVTHDPLDSTDKWAYHIVALADQAIHGMFPITGYTPVQLQAFIDHIELTFRTLGPAWYLAQINADDRVPTPNAVNYAGIRTSLNDGAAIYTDIVTAAGVLQGITGEWWPMAATIRAGFNPENRNLGN